MRAMELLTAAKTFGRCSCCDALAVALYLLHRAQGVAGHATPRSFFPFYVLDSPLHGVFSSSSAKLKARSAKRTKPISESGGLCVEEGSYCPR